MKQTCIQGSLATYFGDGDRNFARYKTGNAFGPQANQAQTGDFEYSKRKKEKRLTTSSRVACDSRRRHPWIVVDLKRKERGEAPYVGPTRDDHYDNDGRDRRVLCEGCH
jgi:hypothetical protein